MDIAILIGFRLNAHVGNACSVFRYNPSCGGPLVTPPPAQSPVATRPCLARRHHPPFAKGQGASIRTRRRQAQSPSLDQIRVRQGSNDHPGRAEVVTPDPYRRCMILDIAACHAAYGIVTAEKNARSDRVALDWEAVLTLAAENPPILPFFLASQRMRSPGPSTFKMNPHSTPLRAVVRWRNPSVP